MRCNLNTHVNTTLLNRVGMKIYFWNSMLSSSYFEGVSFKFHSGDLSLLRYPSHAVSLGKFRYITHIRRRLFLSKYIRTPYTQTLMFIHVTTELLTASLNKPLVIKYNNEINFLTKIHSPRMLQV